MSETPARGPTTSLGLGRGTFLGGVVGECARVAVYAGAFAHPLKTRAVDSGTR